MNINSENQVWPLLTLTSSDKELFKSNGTSYLQELSTNIAQHLYLLGIYCARLTNFLVNTSIETTDKQVLAAASSVRHRCNTLDSHIAAPLAETGRMLLAKQTSKIIITSTSQP